MELNLTKYRNHSVTYSSENVSSVLNDIHSVQDPLEWNPDDGIYWNEISGVVSPSTFTITSPLSTNTTISGTEYVKNTLQINGGITLSIDGTGTLTILSVYTSEEWLKVNLYYLTTITKIDIEWDGSCDYFKIEYSMDNENWEILSDTFVPSSQTLSISYDNVDAVFLRLTVTYPIAFSITDFSIYSDESWDNEDVISHNYMRAFGSNFRENYPLFPSIIKDIFKMMENYNNLNKKLLDESIYTSTSVSCSLLSNVGQLSVSNLILEDGLQYVWDYDDETEILAEGIDGSADTTVGVTFLINTDIDLSEYSSSYLEGKYIVIISGMNTGSYEINSSTNYSDGNVIEVTTPLLYTSSNMKFKIQDITETQLEDNPNIIVSSNPLVNPVDHEYSNKGLYYPRLLVISNDYILEFNTKITVI